MSPPEGPSLLVTWTFHDSDVPLCSRYYPPAGCSMLRAEDNMLGWFRKKELAIVDFEWAWGFTPRGLPKSRIIPVPLRSCAE